MDDEEIALKVDLTKRLQSARRNRKRAEEAIAKSKGGNTARYRADIRLASRMISAFEKHIQAIGSSSG